MNLIYRGVTYRCLTATTQATISPAALTQAMQRANSSSCPLFYRGTGLMCWLRSAQTHRRSQAVNWRYQLPLAMDAIPVQG